MSHHDAGAMAEVENRVRRLLADVTRYPLDLVTPDAHLEDDLGIDSLKQVEIFLRIESEFSLPKEPRLERPERLTPRGIAEAIAAAVPPTVSAPPLPGPTPPAPSPARLAAPPTPKPAAADEPIAQAIQRLIGLLESRGVEPGSLRIHASAPRRRVVWVTGAGQGLSRRIALHLGRRGYAVALSASADQSAETVCAEIRAAGGEARTVPGATADATQARAMSQAIEDAFGSIDVLVAGAPEAFAGPSDEVEARHWDEAMAAGVKGLHHAATEAVRLMALRPQGAAGGRIVDLTSDAARHETDGMVPGVVGAAAQALVRCLAVDLGRRGVTVNAVAAPLETLSGGTGTLEAARAVELLADEPAASTNGAVWTVGGESPRVAGDRSEVSPRERRTRVA